MAQLDARLVGALGLSHGAPRPSRRGAKAAGLKVPSRFGTEVVARLLGLRLNHPASEDALELLPNDPATRAEAAYSVAQMLNFDGWEVAGRPAARRRVRPSRASATWQTQILDTAVARIGMPYIWGGTSDGPETEFGVSSRGGYDCSGFVWRVYKLQPYPDEGTSPSTLRGRTTFQMSGEVPALAAGRPREARAGRRHLLRRQGPEIEARRRSATWASTSATGGSSTPPSTASRVARLDGWYAREFAWGRRPLREAGLES